MDGLTNSDLKGYQLHEKIGAGGFGEVYRATQASVGRDVAIKVVLPKLANETEFIRRFEIEAQLVASLEHPHITPLYDYWRDPDGAYLVMRYLPRGSLADALIEGPYHVVAAARLLGQLGSALDLAHRNGVVHRDIKPSNVLLDDDGNAYLTDFGIAKSTKESDGSLTGEGALIGSPDYLSPEQARGHEVTRTSDVYSLGVLLHETLTGHHPFLESTAIERIAHHLHDPLPTIDDLPEAIRAAVNDVIQTATAKDPSQRYGAAGEMDEAFRQAIAGASPTVAAELGASVAAGTTARLGPIENPFRGLLAFRAADADRFFGREMLVYELVQRLAEEDSARLLALIGPSGSGKSSVLHAGLIPALRRGAVPGSSEWFVTDMVPGAHPLDELEVALTRVASQAAPSLHEHLLRDERGLLRAAQLLLPDDDSDLLLVIDQFEEAFTLAADEDERKRFLALLTAAATDPRSRIRIVLTMRADFFDRPLHYPGFAEVLKRRVETVVPMSADELERAITAPAEAEGLAFEPGLVPRIIEQVHQQPGALPLLQFALTRLFEERDGRSLSNAAFDRIGGVGGALANRAEDVYQQQGEAAREAIRQMTLRLVALGDGSEDTRRRVLRSELVSVASEAELMQRVIERFAEQRLLTLDHDPRTREPTVQLAHEALLREWERLGRWLEESRADVRTQRELAHLTTAWESAGRDESFLLRGSRLRRYDDWWREADLPLAPGELRFLQASVAEREREEALERERRERAAMLQRRARNFLSALVVVLAIGFVASGSLGLWANVQRGRAVEAEADARTRSAILLASQAEAEAEDGQADRAVLLAIEALEAFPYVPQAERALASAVSKTQAVQQFEVTGQLAAGVAWSPDGRTVAIASEDGAVRLWDPRDGTERTVLPPPGGTPGEPAPFALAVRYALDGEHLYLLAGNRFLSGSQDYRLIRWNLSTNEPVDVLDLANDAPPEILDPGAVGSRAYWSGDGLDVGPRSGRLVSLAGDDRALVWSPDLAQVVFELEGHDDDVSAVAWSPDERFVATASLDGKTLIWDGADGQLLRILPSGDDPISAATWSPDGTRIATAGTSGVLRIWSVLDDRPPQATDLRAGRLQTLAWSPDGTKLVVGARDAFVRVIDVATGTVTSTIEGIGVLLTPFDRVRGRGAEIQEVYSGGPADSAGLASGDVVLEVDGFDVRDSTVAEAADRIRGPIGSTVELRIQRPGSDAERVFTIERSTIRTTNIATGTVTAALGGHQDEIVHAAWSPDGDRFATVALDGATRIWTALPASTVARLPFVGIGAMSWSSDGRSLVAPYGNLDETIPSDAAGVGIWDAELGAVTQANIDRSGRSHFWLADYAPDAARILALGVHDYPDELVRDARAVVYDAVLHEIVDDYVSSDRAGVLSAAWSPDGSRVALGSYGGRLDLLEVTGDGTPVGAEHGDGVPISEVAWSPDGTRVATAGHDGTVSTWQASDGSRIATFELARGPLHSVAWSPDGARLLLAAGPPPGTVGADGAAYVLAAEDGNRIHEILGHAGDVTDAVWSPDGARFATIGSDDSVRIWNAASGSEVLRLEATVGSSARLAWSPDGRSLAVGNDASLVGGRIVRVWTDTDDLLEFARSCCVFRDLTEAERREFALDLGTSVEDAAGRP